MVSAESAAATLFEGGHVDTDVNLAAFERLSVLFELNAEQAAIAVLVTRGLAGQPGLAGELARRWGFVAVDLTSDDDPLADPAELSRNRVLVGMSLLSQERRRERLIRLNRGRDRFHVLGLHVVLLLDDVDVRVLHELAPDFASRVHELLEVDASAYVPARAGVLSPLGPVAPPTTDHGSFLQPQLLAELSGLGITVSFGDQPPPPNTGIDVAWSFADRTHTWVAWVERDRWDDERVTRWLREVGLPRLLVVFGGEGEMEVNSDVASMLWINGPADRVDIALTPEIVAETESVAQPTRPAGGLTWLIHDVADRSVGDDIAKELDARRVTVLRSEDYTALKLRAHSRDDAVILLLSPAALASRKIIEIANMLRPHEHWRFPARSIVLLDRVSSAVARELVGSDATLLTLRSPAATADEIVRILLVSSRHAALRILLVIARPTALPLLDPRRSVAPIAEALAGLEAQVDLRVLLRPSLRTIAREIQDADDDGRPFQILHIDAHASSDTRGQTCVALDGEGELQVPLATLGWEAYRRGVNLFVLDLWWAKPEPTPASEQDTRDLLTAGVLAMIVPATLHDSTQHHEFIEHQYETIVAGEAIDTAYGPSPIAPDLRVARQDVGEAPIPTIPGFVDRFAELLELDVALRRHPIVALHGAEGVGKSSLAAEFARWQRQMRRFEQVVWLTPEHAFDGLAVVAARLLLDGEGSVREVLRARAVLLVLDAWDEWGDHELLDQVVGLDRTRVLLTVREPPERDDCFAFLLSPHAS